jgi:hypothetical protein
MTMFRGRIQPVFSQLIVEIRNQTMELMPREVRAKLIADMESFLHGEPVPFLLGRRERKELVKNRRACPIRLF